MPAKNKEIWGIRVNEYRKSKKSARKWCEENNFKLRKEDIDWINNE